MTHSHDMNETVDQTELEEALRLAEIWDAGHVAHAMTDNLETNRMLNLYAELDNAIPTADTQYYNSLTMALLGDLPEGERAGLWSRIKGWWRWPRPGRSWRYAFGTIIMLTGFLFIVQFSYNNTPKDSNNALLGIMDLMSANNIPNTNQSYLFNTNETFVQHSRSFNSSSSNYQFSLPDEFAGENEDATSNSITTESLEARFVIQEASMSLIVEDILASQAQVQEILTQQGGYIVALESNQSESNNPRATVVMRVPAGNFLLTLDDLKALEGDLIHEQIGSQDVTEEYVDLESQIRNLELAETEIAALLANAEERGESSNEILNIYDDLTELRGEIERLRGRMQYLSESSQTSLITVDLITQQGYEAAVPPEFSVGRVSNEAWVSLVSIGQTLLTYLIWLVVHAPLLLIPYAILVTGRWLIKRNQPRESDT